MYFHLITPLAIGAVALAMLTVSLGRNEYAAFIALMVAATSQASNPLEWGYPSNLPAWPCPLLGMGCGKLYLCLWRC